VSCVGCGLANLERVRPYRLDSSRGRLLFGASWLFRCRDCGLVQAKPLPGAEELADYYATTYRTGGRHGAEAATIRDFPKDNLFYYHRGQSIAALLDPHLKSRNFSDAPRVLDIGAGFGHLLHAFGERFPRAARTALELSESCFPHLETLGIRVIREPIESWLTESAERFDVILLSHVLEHLRQPVEVLQRLRSRLSPNGLLFVEVPNIPADPLNRYLDHAWAPRFDEPHLTFFSLATFNASLQRAGLEVLFCAPAGPEYRDIPGWRFKLPQIRPFLVRVLPAGIKRALRRNAATTPLQSFGRAEPFFEYGGRAIWIRSVSAPGVGEPAP